MKNSISFQIAMLTKKHRSLAHELLHKQANLFVGQEMLLHTLWEQDGISQSELAKKLDLKQATVAKSLKRMEEGDFVRRERHETDSRIFCIYLTEKGKEIRNLVEKAWQDLELQTIKNLTDQEISMFRSLLEKVVEGLS